MQQSLPITSLTWHIKCLAILTVGCVGLFLALYFIISATPAPFSLQQPVVEVTPWLNR